MTAPIEVNASIDCKVEVIAKIAHNLASTLTTLTAAPAAATHHSTGVILKIWDSCL